MPDRIGLELLADRVRAVALGRHGRTPRAAAELPWDPAHPQAAVAELRARLGVAGRIGVAVGTAFLDVRRVALPPVRGDARRRLVALDPTRVFATREPVVVALAREAPPPRGGEAADEPAFALPREQLRRWVAALEGWGPVDSVEPAPAALARVADAFGPGHPRVDDPWTTALGAALGADEAPPVVQLLPDDLAHAVRRRRVMAVVRAGGLCVLAVALALGVADRQRTRRAVALERALRAEAPRAAAAESLRARLATLDAAAREEAALAAGRVEPLQVLAALGDRLPEGAAVATMRAQGDAWVVEGTARAAEALVSALAGDARLSEVRAVAPSGRLAERGAVEETFAVAFRVVGSAP